MLSYCVCVKDIELDAAAAIGPHLGFHMFLVPVERRGKHFPSGRAA